MRRKCLARVLKGPDGLPRYLDLVELRRLALLQGLDCLQWKSNEQENAKRHELIRQAA